MDLKEQLAEYAKRQAGSLYLSPSCEIRCVVVCEIIAQGLVVFIPLIRSSALQQQLANLSMSLKKFDLR